MSQDFQPGIILDASQLPYAEVFSGYLDTMTNISQNAEAAPEGDVEFHQIALNSVKEQAREHLEVHPELIAFYKTVGSMAMPEAEEQIQQEIASSEQLISYVQAGLLDKLTIEQLEDRIKIARLKAEVLPHASLLQSAFGDLLEETTSSTVPKPLRKRRAKAKPASVATESEQPLEGPIAAILEQADLSDEARAFVNAALTDGAKLLTLRNNNDAFKRLSEDDYVAFKASLTGVRDGVTALLSREGVDAIWEVTGKTRGTTYRLISTANNIPVVESKQISANEEEQDSYNLEQFSSDLFKVTQYVINSDNPLARSQKYISTRIAEWLDIPLNHASQLVDRQIGQGLLVRVGIEKGSPVLEVVEQPPEPTPIRSMANSRKRRTASRPRTDRKNFSADDMLAAKGIFDLIASAGSHDTGVGLSHLIDHFDMSEREARSFVTRLAKAGVCRAIQVLDETSAADKTRKTTVIVKFPSRGAWNRFRTNPTDYLSILPTGK